MSQGPKLRGDKETQKLYTKKEPEPLLKQLEKIKSQLLLELRDTLQRVHKSFIEQTVSRLGLSQETLPTQKISGPTLKYTSFQLRAPQST